MKILLITWNYPPKIGGMEMMLSELVSSLLDHAEVTVLAPPTDQPEARPEKMIRASHSGLLWFMLEALWKGSNELRSNSYDVIIAGSTLFIPITLLLGRFFKCLVVANIYGLDIIYPNPFYQWMVKIFLPRCDRVIAISHAAKEMAIGRRTKPERIVIVHPGICFSEFEERPDTTALRRAMGIQDRLVLLSAGRLAKRKGVLEFVQNCLPTIVKSYPQLLFLVAGGNPTDSLSHKDDIQSQIEKEVQNKGLKEHVRMLGRVSRKELINLFFICDIFVLPAIPVEGDMEGFGIVLIEAGAAGKPVISTRLGGIPDAVVDNKSGLLVEAESWDALSETIIMLLGDIDSRNDMGEFGRRRAEKELDWSIIGQSYYEVLNQLIP